MENKIKSILKSAQKEIAMSNDKEQMQFIINIKSINITYNTNNKKKI